ncbi:putative Rep protein [Circovirus-like genome DCCV-1]|uniref:putative Rep protein n=1 Tax=Circovirus-like genome DCCV-1 TaxID=1788437 RepID=UPI0007F9FC66|nr:putative Rep protein [Circovirus-like genome DCCV-1]AMB42952.1 putative Rep protein [Circovirus-like genome DCCV-1]
MATRHVVFTINNWTEEIWLEVTQFDWLYVVVGKEIGESGTPHLQGYGCFHKKQRYATLARKWKGHFEVSRGTPQQASDYCKKGGDYFEKGELPESQSAKGGEATKKLYEDAFSLAQKGEILSIPEPLRTRFYATYKKVAKDYMPKPESLSELKNLWICGEAGVGKTVLADLILPDAYSKNCNKWWDGYQNEPGVIINDLGIEHKVLGHHLKLWGEHRGFIAETKGGALHIRPERIIITSQYEIGQVFEDWETRDAIRRRYKQHKLTGAFTREALIELASKL